MQEVAARLSRRALIKTGLLGTLLVGLGSVGLALRKTTPRASLPTLHVLDATEFTILSAIAEREFPALGEGAPGAAKLELAQLADEMLLSLDAEVQKGFKMALRIFDNALSGALAGERLRPFTQLEGDEQDRVLAAWRDSSAGVRRTIFRGFSSLLSSLYWGNPATWKRIGYELPSPGNLRSAYASQLVDLESLRVGHAAKEN